MFISGASATRYLKADSILVRFFLDFHDNIDIVHDNCYQVQAGSD